MPGATQIPANADGGPMLGGPPRAVWHTTESDPHETSASSIARYLNRVNYQCHLVWNPISGEVVQIVSAHRAGRALENESGGVETNQQGRVCIQIEVVGRAEDPFTDGPCNGLSGILDWLDSWSIPPEFPAGEPLPYPDSYGNNGQRDVSTWLDRGGHYGHSQVPENQHGDPGAIDTGRILNEEDVLKTVLRAGDHQIVEVAPGSSYSCQLGTIYDDPYDITQQNYYSFFPQTNGPYAVCMDGWVRGRAGQQVRLAISRYERETDELVSDWLFEDRVLAGEADRCVLTGIKSLYDDYKYRMRVYNMSEAPISCGAVYLDLAR